MDLINYLYLHETILSDLISYAGCGTQWKYAIRTSVQKEVSDCQYATIDGTYCKGFKQTQLNVQRHSLSNQSKLTMYLWGTFGTRKGVKRIDYIQPNKDYTVEIILKKIADTKSKF